MRSSPWEAKVVVAECSIRRIALPSAKSSLAGVVPRCVFLIISSAWSLCFVNTCSFSLSTSASSPHLFQWVTRALTFTALLSKLEPWTAGRVFCRVLIEHVLCWGGCGWYWHDSCPHEALPLVKEMRTYQNVFNYLVIQYSFCLPFKMSPFSKHTYT